MIIGQEFSPHRQFTGYIVPECVMSYDGISIGAKLCLAVLYRFIGKNERAWPKQEAIAKRMGCSTRSLQSYLAELESDGFLTCLQRGLGKPNLYKAKWHRIFEEDDTQDVAYPDPQDPADQDTQDSSHPEAQDSSQPTYRTEVGQVKRVNCTEEISEHDLNLEDPIEDFLANSSRRARGPKIKLSRKQDARLLGRWQQAEKSTGQAELRGGWLRFLGWLTAEERSIDHPQEYFLHAIGSWVGSAPRPGKPSHPPAPALPVAVVPNYPALWNSLVPAAPVEWDSRRSPVAALEQCARDEQFQQRFEEFCQVAQAIHAARGADASWLTFEWAIKAKAGQVGWWRLLTDLRKMSVAPAAKKTKFEQNLEYTKQAMAMFHQEQVMIRERTRTRPQ